MKIIRLGALLMAGYVAGLPLCFAEVALQSQTSTATRYQASGEGLPFDAARYHDFKDYAVQTRERLKRHRVFLNPHRARLELAAATPFERRPGEHCKPVDDGRAGRGILLVHGLSDTPLAMTDLADAFAK